MRKKILATVILLSLGACATLFDGSRQKVKVEVVDISNNKILQGAKCTATDEMNYIYMVPDNPGIIKVRKGQGELQFDCKKDGYIQRNAIVGENFNNSSFFNVFTFGAGFVVDAVSGAMLEYPSHIIIKMERQ